MIKFSELLRKVCTYIKHKLNEEASLQPLVRVNKNLSEIKMQVRI